MVDSLRSAIEKYKEIKPSDIEREIQTALGLKPTIFLSEDEARELAIEEKEALLSALAAVLANRPPEAH